MQSSGKTTVGTKIITRVRPRLAIFAVWKYWSVSQAVPLFGCFSSYCVDYYWSRSKEWFPENTYWCSTDDALLHISSTSYIISHHDNRWKQCGNRTTAGMKHNIGANLMKQLNTGGGISCVLASVVCCIVWSLFATFKMNMDPKTYSEEDFKCC